MASKHFLKLYNIASHYTFTHFFVILDCFLDGGISDRESPSERILN